MSDQDFEPRAGLDDDPLWDDHLDELAWALRLNDDPHEASQCGALDPTAPILDLPTLDPQDLSVPQRVDALVLLQRLASRVAALEADVMVSLMGASPVGRDVVVLDRTSDDERTITLTDEMREELALALRRTPSQVHEQVQFARLLATHLPATRAALFDGLISAPQARVIAAAAERLHAPGDATDAFAEACARLEARVVPAAMDLTVSQTRELARRTVESIDRDAARRRRLAARHQIDVRVYAEDDGLAVLFARLPALDAVRLRTVIEARAGQTGQASLPGQPSHEQVGLTAGQRRAAALVDLVCGADSSDSVALEVGVVVDLPTLLGLSDSPARVTGVAGSTVDVSAIREALDRAPAILRRLVCDPPHGALIDRGRRTYRVTGALRDFLVARDSTCRFPGCGQRAERCQIDHAVPWEDEGRTDAANLGALCVRHHQLKTHGGWQITDSSADGACTWRSPLGRVAAIPPRSLLPEPEPPPDEFPF